MYMISLYNCFLCSDNFSAIFLQCLFPSLIESRGSSGWRLLCLWWYHELSLRRLVVPLVAAGLWAWWSPVFSARLAWYLYSFTVTLTSLQCACCVVKLLYYAGIFFFSIIIELFFFSQWKQGVVPLTALSALVVLWVVSTTNCGATVKGGVYRLDDTCFQCLFNMIFTLDFTVICASLKCIWYFSLNTCFTMLG